MDFLSTEATIIKPSLAVVLGIVIPLFLLKHTSAMTIKYPQRTVFGSKVTIEINDESFPSDKESEVMDATLPGCKHDFFDSKSHNCKLHYRYFLPKGDVKGVAVFFHGINSHSGRGLVIDGRKLSLSLMLDEFMKEGIAMYWLDMYGHGYSEGSRFLVKKWEWNKQDCIDFADFIAEKYDEKTPLFVAGESYGGCLATHTSNHLQKNPDSPAGKMFDSMLLSAPAIYADLPGFPVYQILRYVVAPLIPTRRPFFMPHPIAPERIWREKGALEYFMSHDYQKYRLDDAGTKIRLGAALGVVMAMENLCKEVIPKFEAPFCIIHGTMDEGVPIAGSEYMMKTCVTPDGDKELHAIEGARHEVLCDPLSEEAIANWMKFVKRRVEKRSQK